MVLPLDMPDDYPWLPGSGKSTLGDLGELAARLGSIVTYDRRGSVYWLDDFESGLSPWLPGGGGAGWDVRIVHTPTFRGDFSCRLTGGSNGNRNAVVIKRLAPATLYNYGFETTFSFDSDADKLYLILQVNNGITRNVGRLNIDVANQKLRYLNSTNTFTDFATVIIPSSDKYLFSTAKLVIDFQNNIYLRVLYNQSEYDLSDIPIYSVPDTSDPRIEVTVMHHSTSGNNGIAYVDSAIVTIGDV